MPSFSLAATYCLSAKESPLKAKKQIQEILLSDEGVIANSSTNCLEVAVREYRRPLVDKFMKMSFDLRSSSSLQESSRQLCKFTLRKVEAKNSKSNDFSLGRDTRIKVSFSGEKIVSNSDLIVMEGRTASLSMDDESIYLKCDKRGSLYELSFSLKRNFMTKMSTSLDITPGQWVNVGSIEKDLSKKSKSVSIEQGLNYSDTKGVKKHDYYITVSD